MHRYLIDEQEIQKIKEQGCCLGKYRVLLDKSYYCYLEGVFDCENQDKVFVKELRADMYVCKTNKQLPCEECDSYKIEKLKEQVRL